MLTSNELELRADLSLGTLESNAEQIRDFVTQRLQDYTPANYEGKAAEAKADRAVLNAAEKTLNSRRLELERQYMEPFNAFKNIISDTCKMIKQASGQLDEIVKVEENREKDVKREAIQSYWDNQDFTLYPLDKVFDDKWLNKTAKMKDIQADIDAKIKKTFDDLKILENFPAEDVPLLKAEYLNTLDITAAMQKAEMLKANRERLAQEAKEREIKNTNDALKAQNKDEVQDRQEVQAREGMGDLLAQITGDPADAAPKKYTFALLLRGTEEELLKVREYMTMRSVTYDKLVDRGNGIYVLEEK